MNHAQRNDTCTFLVWLGAAVEELDAVLVKLFGDIQNHINSLAHPIQKMNFDKWVCHVLLYLWKLRDDENKGVLD